MHRNRLIAGIALGLVIGVAALGEEKKIKQSKLPQAVQHTAEQHSTGATVTGYTSEKVDGAMVYTMDLVASGLTRGIVMDSEGNILSTEQEVAWSDVPAEIQKDFTNVSTKGKLEAVSTVSTNGTIVAYEAVLVVNGERHHVRVKPNAANLAPAPVAAPGASK
jgi:hypothetical protein